MKRNEILSEFKKGIKAVKYNKKPKDTNAEFSKAKEKLAPQKPLEEGVEDRISYQVAKVLHDNGVTYDSARESELINVIGLALVKKLDMSPKEARAIMNDEDFLGDTMGELRHMEQGVAEGYRDRRDAYQRDYDSSVAGMGKRQSRAYQDDGGANDERHDLDPSDWYIVKDGKMYKTSVYPNQEQEAMSRGYSRTREQAKARADSNTGSTDEAMGADMGKITKVDPVTKKATLTKPDGSSMEIDSTALKPTPDGKMSMDTPELKTGTSVVSTEESSDVPYQVKNGPQPMAMTSPKPTAIVASKRWTAITPDIEAKATQQGFRKVMLKVNGQLVPGLEGGDQALGSKIIVSPADFQTMAAPPMKEAGMVPPTDSASPISGDNNHDGISTLLVQRLKRLAGL
jgi:hypothetical protein